MKKLQIALVDPPLRGHKRRGIGIYTDELYKALKKGNEVDVRIEGFNSDLSGFDVVHYPYFDPFFLTLPIKKTHPTLVTVHDLIPLKFPEFFPRGIKGSIKWLIQRYSLKTSKSIITDSEASKKDIINFTGIRSDIISVVNLGVSKEFKIINSAKILSDIKKKYKLNKDFILHVGDVNYNKNIPGLVQAFSLVSRKHPGLELILVGKGFNQESLQLSDLLHLISELNLVNKIKLLGYIDITDLVGIYNLAKMYIQVSFAEGFGLTVLEAMACGCPTVVSNISSLPELVGNAAVLVSPFKSNDISRGISEILNNPIKRLEIINKGFQRVKGFSWEKCAGETVNIYKGISG